MFEQAKTPSNKKSVKESPLKSTKKSDLKHSEKSLEKVLVKQPTEPTQQAKKDSQIGDA